MGPASDEKDGCVVVLDTVQDGCHDECRYPSFAKYSTGASFGSGRSMPKAGGMSYANAGMQVSCLALLLRIHGGTSLWMCEGNRNPVDAMRSQRARLRRRENSVQSG